MPGTALGTIPTPFVGSTTGTISPVSPLGSPSTTVCSTTPGGPPTNGAALPLSTPEVPSSPPPGTIQPTVAVLADTSIDPTTGVMPTPNTSACAESMTMNLATPGTMAPANATGAAATPGVSPAAAIGLLNSRLDKSRCACLSVTASTVRMLKPKTCPTPAREHASGRPFLKCYLVVQGPSGSLCVLLSGPPRLPPEAVFRLAAKRTASATPSAPDRGGRRRPALFHGVWGR